MNTIRLEKLTKNSLTKEILEAYKRRTNNSRKRGKGGVLVWLKISINLNFLVINVLKFFKNN